MIQAPIKDGMNTTERFFKRTFDIGASICCLIMFSPLMLLCWAAIHLYDHKYAIFKQERIGKGGKPFHIYKFRSMDPNEEESGIPQLCNDTNDLRLTHVGRFLRAHHLDELPQFWNVLTGDMSFIGPRPERKYFIDQIMEHDSRYELLYQIRPGITSYATLYNGYTDTMEKMLKRLELDLQYLENRSCWLDIKILLLTFYRIVRGDRF